jgi:hypothetical protein
MSSTGGLQIDSANICTQLSEPPTDTLEMSQSNEGVFLRVDNIGYPDTRLGRNGSQVRTRVVIAACARQI